MEKVSLRVPGLLVFVGGILDVGGVEHAVPVPHALPDVPFFSPPVISFVPPVPTVVEISLVLGPLCEFGPVSGRTLD